MEKIKKLPEILITGKTQDLIEIETLLVMAGYNKPDESHNNYITSQRKPRRLKCYITGYATYFEFIEDAEDGKFEAKEVDKILNFIETYSNTK
jgi:hypothetical protein